MFSPPSAASMFRSPPTPVVFSHSSFNAARLGRLAGYISDEAGGGNTGSEEAYDSENSDDRDFIASEDDGGMGGNLEQRDCDADTRAAQALASPSAAQAISGSEQSHADDAPSPATGPAADGAGAIAQGAGGERSQGAATGASALGAALPTPPGTSQNITMRLNRDSVFLTYAGCSKGELDKHNIIASLRNAVPAGATVREYMVSVEQHSSPSDPEKAEHYHVYLRISKRWDLRLSPLGPKGLTSARFSLEGAGGRTLKPFLVVVGKTAGDKQRLLQYIAKDGDVDMRLEEIGEVFPAMGGGPKGGKNDWGSRVKLTTSAGEAIAMLARDYPSLWFKDGGRIEEQIRRHFREYDRAAYEMPPILELEARTSGLINARRGKGRGCASPG